VRFDIILDHTADFADAIVGHGLGRRENVMDGKTIIVAETGDALRADGGPAAPAVHGILVPRPTRSSGAGPRSY
jgi:hypothetical protein